MQSVASSAPVPADGFEWDAAPWGRQLVAHALKDFKHGWTTRQLQLRGSRDVERAGWAQIAEAADVQPAAVLRMHQVHGVAVHRASAADIGTPPHEADVIRTDDHEIALAVQVADCVPLLLGDPPSGRIAAAWHGVERRRCGGSRIRHGGRWEGVARCGAWPQHRTLLLPRRARGANLVRRFGLGAIAPRSLVQPPCRRLLSRSLAGERRSAPCGGHCRAEHSRLPLMHGVSPRMALLISPRGAGDRADGGIYPQCQVLNAKC
jgi:hypothetical protein